MTSWKESSAARLAARGLLALERRRERSAPLTRVSAGCWSLATAALWERAPDEVRRALSDHMGVRRHDARVHVALDHGGDVVYLLLEGGAKLYRASAGGRKLVEAIVAPGDVFGRLGASGHEEEAAALETLEATRLGLISRDAFQEALRRHPDFAFEVVQYLDDRTRRLARALHALAFKDVETRLAETLVALARAEGEACSHGFAVDLRLSQTDLAELVGASRQVVNQTLGRFERRMLVQRIGRVICILELDRLDRFAHEPSHE
ncbi:MAG: Crp/Fnr family transcriptional regulator [Myxococcales bacterium]|nr:Crp/Fnr family transcriptional regulator [Myxococcales bacterium]